MTTLRHKMDNGAKYSPELDRALERSRTDIVDELTTPHTRIPEKLGGGKITSKVPAYNPQAQPVQARGRIVWNKAYEFQPKGPSYLDGSDR